MAEEGLLDVVTFGPELNGEGWYWPERTVREQEGITHYRWCGLEERANLRFIGRGARQITLVCDVLSIIDNAIIPSLVFEIDGNRARFEIAGSQQGATVFEITGLRENAGPISELVIHCPERRTPRDLDIGPDARTLALAIRRVKVLERQRDINGR
jgi:hypothetical protein